MSALSAVERRMIENACRLDRNADQQAAAGVSRCVRQQLDALQASGGKPDLDPISPVDRRMIEAACGQDRQIGPAAYYRCLRQQVEDLNASPETPDLSALPGVERQRIEAACRLDRQMSGPAAYRRCLRRELEAPSAGGSPAPSDLRRRRKSGALSPSTSTASSPSTDPAPDKDRVGAPRKASFPLAALMAGLAGVLVVAFSAKIIYDRVKPARCGRCGAPATRGQACAACAADVSTKRNPGRRQVDTRARAEAGRDEREQSKIEESRRAAVLSELEQLTGPQFEDLIASLFRKDGYAVRPYGGSGDEGIDLLLQMGQERDVARCGRSQNDIDRPAVREFYGALMHVGARHGFIVTTASFSPGARDFARGKPISLISGPEILPWIDGASSAQDYRACVPAANHDGRVLDPYEVLGVSPTANPEEIRAAYHREMVNYHPDKVAHLGKDLREFAQAKAQEINRAYAELAQSR